MLRWERRDRIVMVILMTWSCPYWPELRHEVIALIDTVTRVKVHWVRSYHLELMKWFLASGFKCRSCFLSHADPNILTWWVYVMNVCVRGGRIYVRDSGGAGVTSDTWWDQVSRGGHHSWPTPAQFHCPDTMITTAHHCPLWHVSCVLLCPAQTINKFLFLRTHRTSGSTPTQFLLSDILLFTKLMSHTRNT